MAVLADFSAKDGRSLQIGAPAERWRAESPVDPTLGVDMWDRWSFSADAPERADVVIEAPWWERHGISLPHTIYQLQDIATLDEESGLWRLD